jgi:hypothetical protein
MPSGMFSHQSSSLIDASTPSCAHWITHGFVARDPMNAAAPQARAAMNLGRSAALRLPLPVKPKNQNEMNVLRSFATRATPNEGEVFLPSF